MVRAPDLAAAQTLLRQGGYAGALLSPAAALALPSPEALARQQAKFEALYQAGLELAALEPEQLARLTAADRVARLKANILKQVKSLLGYDRVDIRLLQPQTGLLEPLVCEGMDEDAASLQLYAKKEGFGSSGYVAATGESYYVPDTAADRLYIQGAASTQSSLTVPLLHHGQVVGVLTLDSPQRDGFSPADRQLIELFGREIGAALHTLRLLTAERADAADESVEAISREVALPVDAILGAATSLLDRYIGLDPEMAAQLQLIRAQARSIKECVLTAGHAVAPERDSKPAPKEQPLAGLKVLVADADELTRRSAHKILAKLGCEVETADTAAAAVAMARHTAYDVALADLQLPDKIGYETFRSLKDADPGLAVALMSGFGYDPSHSIIRAKQEGLAGALYKPFRVDQLLDVMKPRSARQVR